MSALALSLMLAGRPTVAVEIHPDPFVEAHAHARMTALRGWLVRRLLEEGYDVASEPAAAHGVVRVRAAGEGLVVEAQGHASRSYAIEPGPEAVLRLEVLHHALLGVEQTCDAHEAIAAPQPGLALRLGEGHRDDALLEAVAVVAQTAGVTLAARPSPGDTLACVDRRGDLAEVSLGPAEADCGPPVMVLELGDGSPDDLRQAARALLDAVRVPAEAEAPLDVHSLGGPPPGNPTPAPPPEPDDDDDDPVPMHGPPRAQARLMASGGVVARGAFVDPLISAGWRMGKIGGLGGRLSASLVPSSGENIRVVDARLVIGPDWEVLVGRRGSFDVALLVGTDLHTYETDTRASGDVALAAELPLSVAWSVRGQLRLHVGVVPGVTARAWEHREGLLRTSGVVWHRPLWRMGVTVGISHGWRIE